MNEEYLWDKSGEPDPEIQKLEEILGTLRYQPKALQLPEELRPAVSNRKHLPWLAIAAAVLIALLGGIVWLRFQSKGLEQDKQAGTSPSAPASSPGPNQIVPENKEIFARNNSPAPRLRREPAVRHTVRRVEPVPSKEALLAKEQLMTALKLASEKLNLAERKVQGPTPNQIRNQHKVG